MKKRNIFREFNDEKWEQVRRHPYYASLREATLLKAEELLATDPPCIKFSDFHKFVTEGIRSAYEAPFGQYTKRMNTYFFCYLLTGDEKYIDPLVDVLWSICDLETWAANSHVKDDAPIKERRRCLDLVSTMLGARISEILYYIGDNFPELAYRRIKEEVRFRIIDCYREKRDVNDFVWYTKPNNWSAVCAANVFATFLYLAEDEEINVEIPRFMATAQCFIDAFPDDGCCLEGTGYWKYGVSHYMIFATMLKEYTDGRIDLYQSEKVRKIAEFYNHAAINDHQGLSFSDGGLGYSPSAWIMHHLKRVYPDFMVPPIDPPTDSVKSLREVLWCDPDVDTCPNKPGSYSFPIAQWFIHVGDKYSVGAKAGCNNEPHNHNDVGSFLISKNNEVTFVDPGGEEYVKTYFSGSRYKHLMPSSRGHSVPVINGHLQCKGTTKSTVYTMTDDRFTFTLDNAYPEACRATLESAVRDFDCRSDKLVLTDTYKFTELPTSLVEQFVSLMPITGESGELHCGDSVLHYDPTLFDAEFGSESFRRNNGKENTLYWVRLAVKNLEKEITLKFEFN